jgi:hypothetical protein
MLMLEFISIELYSIIFFLHLTLGNKEFIDTFLPRLSMCEVPASAKPATESSSDWLTDWLTDWLRQSLPWEATPHTDSTSQEIPPPFHVMRSSLPYS